SSYRLPFVNFLDRPLRLFLNGAVRQDSSAAYYWNIFVDGSGGFLQSNMRVIRASAATAQWNIAHCEAILRLAEARHYATGMHFVSSGTGMAEYTILAGEIWG